jgi:OOP family OmpA-OmpF porin
LKERVVMRKLWMLALASCLALPAGAGDFLVGGSAGQANIEVDAAGFDESDTGFKLFGGWRLLKFLGLEGGYVDFGGPEVSAGGVNANAEVTAWDAFAMGVVPLGKVELFGKAGLVFWDAETSLSVPGFSGTFKDDGTDLAYGVGVSYEVNDNVALRGEWEIFDIESTDVNMLSFGFHVRF